MISKIDKKIARIDQAVRAMKAGGAKEESLRDLYKEKSALNIKKDDYK